MGHPAPFPVELPRRFIELYTYQGDLVLDPFLGSGTTAVAAKLAGRHYVGCEIDPGYVEMASSGSRRRPNQQRRPLLTSFRPSHGGDRRRTRRGRGVLLGRR